MFRGTICSSSCMISFNIIILILLLLGLVSLTFTTSLASIDTTRLPDDEVEALREIGRKLGKTDWDFREDPCDENSSWATKRNSSISSFGQNIYDNTLNCSCDNNTNTCHVVSISLKAQSLPGTLPPEFVKLRFLQNIDLTRNYLNGTIPPQWGSMEQLLNISVLGNRLTGSIPKELGNITTLTTLALEHNLLSGEIPEELGNLSSIERLFLNSNNFTGELPGSFARLTTLKEFRVGDNNFSGKIPNFIQGWTNLKSLMIQSSGMEGPIPPGITLLTNLSDLRISDLKGPDTISPPISNMLSLKNLVLRSCNLIGGLPESLVAKNLKVLDLSFNKLNGSIPRGFSDLQKVDNIYLTGNLLSGAVPDWMLNSGQNIDLSYNNFTYESSTETSCQMRGTNLFGFSSNNNVTEKVPCLGSSVCPRNQYSLYINCGGDEVRDGNIMYEADLDPGGPSRFTQNGNQWGFSNTGHFFDNGGDDSYILKTNASSLYMKNSALYINSRTSAISLTYYAFCLLSGSYKLRLHFAEISFTNDEQYSSLGRRVFDIYIQGVLVEKDFNVEQEAGGVGKEIVKPYYANVTDTLEIRLYWAGKGTTSIPIRGIYGPIISAISVVRDPVPQDGKDISGGTVAGIVVGVVCGIILVLGVFWWRGCLRHGDVELDLNGLQLNTGSFTLRQIKAATNNFSDANKIGEGGFGSVYKGILSDGTIIAVKQLSSKSKQGSREFLNELGVISALQHPHLVKLHGCCTEGNQLLLAYEYMENNSLARALFGPEECQVELDWPTRYRICIGIAKGLAFLHEESRLKIVHRDIKATNVLLDENLNPKISDFGLAKLDEEESTHISTRVAGTYGYMAPEYALRGYLTDKADVYSYGIVLLEIVSGMANIVDRGKENRFILLDRAVGLKETGNLMELVDPRLGSEYNEAEVLVTINIALLCTNLSPTNRPMMSSVVSMLEGRTVSQDFTLEHSVLTNETKLMECNELQSIRTIPYTDSSTSAVDLYPVDPFSQYLEKREREVEDKLLS